MLPLVFLAASGCASPPPGGDDGSAGDVAAHPDATASDAPTSDAPTPDAPTSDAPAPPTDAPAPPDGGDAAACTVSDAGTLQMNYYCDLAAIHVLQHDGAAAEVAVFARVGTGSGCRAFDSIAIVRGTTTLQTFAPDSRADSADGNGAPLGRAPASAMLVSECANETTRLTGYGLIVRGRDARGPFEARCGTADFGSRWPPGTHLACHRNVEQPVWNNPSSTIMEMPVGSMLAANLYVLVPHTPGRPAFTAVDSTIRIVSPERAPFGSGPPLMSVDVPGWMGHASEMTTPLGSFTQLSLAQFGAVTIPSELCPTPPAMPMPGDLPPFFLARITGTGPAGPTMVEALASCVRPAAR